MRAISITHEGETDLKQHAKSDGHKANIKTQSNAVSHATYFSNMNSAQRSNETAAGLDCGNSHSKT
jgi:endonuclease IV